MGNADPEVSGWQGAVVGWSGGSHAADVFCEQINDAVMSAVIDIAHDVGMCKRRSDFDLS